MNRKDEFLEFKNELEQTPEELESITIKSVTRAKKSIRNNRLWKTPLFSLSSITIFFIMLVNLFPTVALAMSNVPLLKDLVRAVAFDSSLKAAVDHNYYQTVGERQTQGNVSVTVDYMILDAKHISIFFKVDAPLKAGSYTYDFRDRNGNELPAAICYDTTYETGKMEEIKIDYTDDNMIPDEFTFTVTVNQNKDFEEVKESSVTVSEAAPSPAVTAAPESVGKDYQFTFRLKPDQKYTNVIRTLPIHQWINIAGQKIYLDSLDIYPTQARLKIDCDENNNSVLYGLDIYFKDNKGTLYQTRSNNISSTYDSQSQNIDTLFLESSYFSDADRLTLYIKGITLIDKDKLYGVIDYPARTISNLPDGVSVESMTLTGSDLDIILKVISNVKNNYQQLISFTYYDDSGKEYNLTSCDTTTTDDKYTYDTHFIIPNYNDHKYKVQWMYAPKQTFDFPFEIQIN